MHNFSQIEFLTYDRQATFRDEAIAGRLAKSVADSKPALLGWVGQLLMRWGQQLHAAKQIAVTPTFAVSTRRIRLFVCGLLGMFVLFFAQPAKVSYADGTPSVTCESTGTAVPDDDTSPSTTECTDFGTVNVGASSSKSIVFIYKNTGGNNHVDKISLTNIDGTGFSIQGPTTADLGDGATLNFTVTFHADVSGFKTAMVEIVNNSSTPALALYNFYITAKANSFPTAYNVSASTLEDTRRNIELLAFDPNMDVLTYTVGSAAHGTVTVTNQFALYTPVTNYNGSDSFTYVASDGNGSSNVATVNLTINAVNDPPMAINGAAFTNEDVPVDVNLTSLVSDVDNNLFTFAIPVVTHGTVTVSGSTARFTPTLNYNGPASFSFQASDGELSAPARTVNLMINAVNDPPVASNASISTAEDTPVDVDLFPLVTDVDSAAFFFEPGSPNGGSVTRVNPTTARFIPTLNYHGAASFTFWVHDSQDPSNVATVNVTVNPVNDAPVANDQSLTTNENTPIVITLTGSDPVEGSPLTFSVVDLPISGTVTLVGDIATYTPYLNAKGVDHFTFKVNDGTLDSAVATVTVMVNAVTGNTCLAGTFYNGTSCVPAPPGSYVPTDGATAATPCEAGSYQDLSGQSSCKSAPSGSFVSAPGATATTLCTPGSYQDQAGQSSCKPAPAGSFVAATGATSATRCTPGFYQDLSGQSSCKPADLGSFVSLTGATAATPCALGSYQDETGQTSCKPAPVDSFVPVPNAITPTFCPAGTYQDQAGQMACLPLPTLSTLSPATVPAGSAAFLLTVNGANFPNGAQVLWNGAALATTFISAAQLTANVPSANIATSGVATITVVTPPSTRQSAALPFAVTAPQPRGITIMLDVQPDSKTNFKFTNGTKSFYLDDITPSDGDAYSNSRSLNLAPGTYTFQEQNLSGWLVTSITCTPAAKGAVDLANRQVTISTTQNDSVTCLFVTQRAGQITAGKYNDRNHNHTRESKDEWLRGWTMQLYSAANALVGAQPTDISGSTTFANLPSGVYTLCEVPQAGWYNITPATFDATYAKPCYTVPLAPGQAAVARFGNSTTPLVAGAEADVFNDVVLMDLPDTDDEGNEVTPLPNPWPDAPAEGATTLFLPLVTR